MTLEEKKQVLREIHGDIASAVWVIEDEKELNEVIRQLRNKLFNIQD